MSQDDLTLALSKMNIPENRKDLTNPDNVQWLLRNLQVYNKDHPLFEGTMLLLKRHQKSSCPFLPGH